MTPSHTSMRTPLSRVKGLGSAKSGTGHFWVQRMTALSNAALATVFLVILATATTADYESAHALVAHPLVAILFLLFVLSALVHMRLGAEIVIEDYIHTQGWNIAVRMANTFFAVAVGVACIYAVLKIAFGA